MTNRKEKSNTRDWLKIALSVLAILTGLAYTGNAWFTYSRGIPNGENRDWEEFRGGRGDEDGRPSWRTEEGRQERFEQTANEIGLSQEQRDQISQIWQAGRPEGPDGWRGRMEQMQSILTPDQQAKAQQMFQSRGQNAMNSRMERAKREAKKKMSPAEYKQFEERLEERARQGRNRGRGGFGRGGPGGGGGGPGGPGGQGGGQGPRGR